MNNTTKLVGLVVALVAVLAVVLVIVSLAGKPSTPPATEPPATKPPVTDPPATNPPATEPPATEPPATEPPATEPPATEPPAAISLNRTDFTFLRTGEKFPVYDGKIKASEVTFSSSNEKVVTFVNGIATAVAPGMAKIYAEYEGVKLECYVHCSFKNSEKVGFVNTDKYTLWSEYGLEDDHDITYSVGEYLNLYLKDAEGNKITPEWTADKEGIVTIEGGKITGAKSGNTILSCTIDDQIIECVIRITR